MSDVWLASCASPPLQSPESALRPGPPEPARSVFAGAASGLCGASRSAKWGGLYRRAWEVARCKGRGSTHGSSHGITAGGSRQPGRVDQRSCGLVPRKTNHQGFLLFARASAGGTQLLNRLRSSRRAQLGCRGQAKGQGHPVR
jgi:hypothetical protein